MEQSEKIDALAAALAAAQGEFKNPKKSSDNPFFSSKYADLTALIDTVKEPLSKNKLSIVQFPAEVVAEPKPMIKVETMLLHGSGQWLKGITTMTVAKLDAQALGSAITYARRYSLQAMLCIGAEDDDGNGASNNAVEHTTTAGVHDNTNAPIKPPTEAHRTPQGQQQATGKGVCENCKKVISPDAAVYSKKQFGKVLCYACQKAALKK